MSIATTRVFKVILTGRRLPTFKHTIHKRFVADNSRIYTKYGTFTPENLVDLKNQSFLIPGGERIRATRLTNDPYKLISEIPSPLGIKVKTVYEVLNHGMKISDDGDCAGMKNEATGKYEYIKYSQVIERSQNFGSAFIQMGLKPKNNSFVGFFGCNRTEFLLTLYACAGYSMILIPMYDSLGPDNLNFIISQANLSLVMVNSDAGAMGMLNAIKTLPALKSIICIHKPSADVVSAAKNTKTQLLTFDELEEIGKKNRQPLVLPEPDDLFCIPYTSGTTGQPKGVMLTHANIVTCISALCYSYGPGCVYGGTIISYLPTGHIYEIMNLIASLHFARRVAFLPPDIKKIFDNIREIKPEIIPLVPRLLNAVYYKVVEQLKTSMLKWYLFQFAMSRKEKKIAKGEIGNDTIWDKVFFKKIQDVFGGNARMIITTSAPLSPEVIRFLRCAAGCYVFEAYGQTEALAATMTLPHEIEGGSVGTPMPCNHVKLIDVPEMNYFAKNDEGEVCFKGPNVFKGYFKAPELTRDFLDSDGWQHSGDIGRWLPNGALKIIDRKKHIFKLSQGEYIAPERIENIYSQSRLVAQVYVDGFTDKDYVVAIVVPETAALSAWAKNKGFKEPMEDLIKNKEFRKEILKRLHKMGDRAHFNPLEQARNISLVLEPFSFENGLLSPTLKLKRNEARKYFQHLLEDLYKDGPLIKSTVK